MRTYRNEPSVNLQYDDFIMMNVNKNDSPIVDPSNKDFHIMESNIQSLIMRIATISQSFNYINRFF